jgi:hypothetical protein
MAPLPSSTNLAIDLADKTRCTLSSSSIGQANAARDKLYDLRQCSLSGASAPGFDLSGVIMTNTDVSKVNFREAYFSKGYLAGTFLSISLFVKWVTLEIVLDLTNIFLYDLVEKTPTLTEPISRMPL